MLQTGDRVAGRFLLEREIARGGMGAVWAGQDQKLRRPVAIKLLISQAEASAALKARFEREAMAVAQLQSPHVVQIFDYGVERGMAFIVMELLEGEDLHARLKRQRRLSIEATGRIVWETCKALGMAHGAGIIHRDMKPANVFLVRQRDDELVKVLDFGVAKAAIAGVDDDTEKTRDGAILGTPQFMSPEQARGLVNSLDHRTDLWSVGVIAYRALTGRLPFIGQTAADQIVQICSAPLPRPSEIAPDLPAAADAFFAKALARDPAHRFESAREMALAFSRLAPASYPSLNLPDPQLPQHAAAPQSWPGTAPGTWPGMPPVAPGYGQPPQSYGPQSYGPQSNGPQSYGQGPPSGVPTHPSLVGTHPSLAIANGLVATQHDTGKGRRTALIALVGTVVGVAAIGSVVVLARSREAPAAAAIAPAAIELPADAAPTAAATTATPSAPAVAAPSAAPSVAPSVSSSATASERAVPKPRRAAPAEPRAPRAARESAPSNNDDVFGERL